MKQQKYDIFISYRRDGGAQYARTLQLMLERKGYRVFLDYDELTDAQFSPQIDAAIRNSNIYILVLSKGSLVRCANEGDWVRREIEVALEAGKRLVPINPDNTFDGIPDGLPDDIKEAVEGTQHSEINFGQTLNATVDLLIKNRIKPFVRHRRPLKGIVAVCIIIAGMVTGCIYFYNKIAHSKLNELKEQITFRGTPVSWSENITKEQLLAIAEIFENMQEIEGGEFVQGAIPLNDGSYEELVEVEFEAPAFNVTVNTFYMSKFEVSIAQWNAIMDDNRSGAGNEPVASVSYNQAEEFIIRLNNFTLKDFRLPTESEWEYAAKGGKESEGYLYAGSNDPDIVAWYAANSGGKVHADLCAEGTVDDLFNMSGNVSEWCSNKFVPYNKAISVNDERSVVVRGGNFDSEPYEITVTHREPALPETSIPTLGFRLAMSK